MAARFSDQQRMNRWLDVERAVLAALIDAEIAPQRALDDLQTIDHVDVDAVQTRERIIHHDLAAFVDVVATQAPSCAGWLHFGLTSSDVVDTAQAIALRDAATEIIDAIRALRAAVLRRAHEHRDTLMLGRTHGMPAEPITFGVKLLGWWHQLGRDEQRLLAAKADIAVGKLSGAVGVYSGLTPEIEHDVLTKLGLARDDSATQVVQRDRHAHLVGSLATLAGSLERVALEVRHLQRAEIAEAAEPFAREQKGSSAMPHKRNPIVAEQICGLARLLRGNAGVALENIALWHERDISHSSVERVIIPDSFLLADYLLDRTTWLIDGLEVDADQMRANLDAQHGAVASQRVLLELVRAGVSRDDAYRAVQVAAGRVRSSQAVSLAQALSSDRTLSGQIAPDRLAALCDPSIILDGVDAHFARVPAPAVD